MQRGDNERWCIARQKDAVPGHQLKAWNRFRDSRRVCNCGSPFRRTGCKQAQTAAGYAKPMSADYQKKQAELVANHIKTQDIVITTALIPGRPAPKLITTAMIESMKSGAVIVDLAAERGGNTELTQPDKVVDHNGVSISGPLNLAGEVPVNASSLYAKNLLAFLELMIDKKDKTLKVNWDDEIIKGTLLARDGKIVHPSLQPKGA